jgi:hypothetical protein
MRVPTRLKYVTFSSEAEQIWSGLSDLERTRIEIVLARVALRALRTDGGPFVTATDDFAIDGTAGQLGQKIFVKSITRTDRA